MCGLLLSATRAAGQNVPPTHAPIIVVLDDNYPPYSFRGKDGALQGIVPELWQLWEKKTGRRAKLVGMDWGKALQYMQEGHADVLDTCFYSEERARLYRFSDPYAEILVPVFNHKDVEGVRDARSLMGFTVGVKTGDHVIDSPARQGHHHPEGVRQLRADRQGGGRREHPPVCRRRPPGPLLSQQTQSRGRIPAGLYSLHRRFSSRRAAEPARIFSRRWTPGSTRF